MTYFVEAMSGVSSGGNVERIGEYTNLDAAVAAAKNMIDNFLYTKNVDKISAAKLFIQYQNLGRVPFIFTDGDTTINVGSFNHLQYAMRRCEEITQRE